MFFETKRLYVDSIEKDNLVGILDVYNSNINFLQAHMSKKSVDADWIKEEIKNTKESGFYTCKIVLKETEKIIGLIDFSLKKECYLSLIMIHNDYKKMGYGKEIYLGFENLLKSKKCKSIRIDVVTNYDNKVLEFWKSNGFHVIDNIELNWTGKVLPAAVMKKEI